VIPILVDEAQMPGADELPPTLAPLVRRNAVEINPVTFDTKRLISTVRKTLAALKVSDTTTRSASPTPAASLDRSNQQVTGPEVEQLYDQALAAFWTEQWDQAVDLLSQVLNQQPDYADAAGKLELARRKQGLALHYAEASAAADAENWEQAVAEYTLITDTDPDYRDTNARLAEAQHQQQLAGLLAEARRLHRARQWAAVIKIGEQLQAIDPDAADPDGLMTSARAELAAEQQAAKLATDYRAALRLLEAGRWEEAVKALEQLTRLDSGYQDASALLNRARRELEQSATLAEEQSSRQAEEADMAAPAQKNISARIADQPLKIITVDEPEPSKQVRGPRHESTKRGRWIILVTLAGLLVLATIIAVVNGYESSKNPTQVSTNPTQVSSASGRAEAFDKLLSHLPAAERSTCESKEIWAAGMLAEAWCSTGVYYLFTNGADARSHALLDPDMKEGDCMRPPGGSAPAVYQHWTKDGMSGVLSCRKDDSGTFSVSWSIDQLGISWDSCCGAYEKLLSKAIGARDEVK
jgi:tetratricopeptide (TPR) repeat protein